MSNLPSGRMKAWMFHLGYDIPKPRPERGMVVGGGEQYFSLEAMKEANASQVLLIN